MTLPPMQFGHFDDEAMEYVITTPQTPFPWINYLGADQFLGLISQTAGGYCFYRDARLRRLLRYRYNSVPLDEDGRRFYIVHGREVWSPAWKPARTDLDHYECRHGQGYTRITGERAGIRAETTFFVPPNDNCEIHRLRLENLSANPADLSVFSCLEFCFWNAYDDMTNFQRNLNIGEGEVDGSVIYHTTEYRERRNHFAFYSVNAPIDGFDCDRGTFLGPPGDFRTPATVKARQSGNSLPDGWSPVASHGLKLTLKPGETRTFTFVLGYVENAPHDKWAGQGNVNKRLAREMISRYATDAAVDGALDSLKKYWRNLLEGFSATTPDSRVNRMANVWNQYQCMVTLNLSRSASSFESGIGRGIGFRDSNQDVMGIAHLVPARARERLIDLASTQCKDGSAYHQFQPLTRRGNNEIGSGFNDDPLWLIAGVSAYIKETGDFSILDEPAPFDNSPGNTAPLIEHLQRSFDHAASRLGPHGLPLIGRADWNDCLNLNCFSTTPDESFQTCTNRDGTTAESVMIAGMFVLYGREFAEICRRTGREADASDALTRIAAMEKAIRDYAWDGAWFLRAFDDAGEKVGSRSCAEGKIFIESQGFCAMAEIGREQGLPMRALDSVKTHLDTDHGIVLHWPAYTQYYLNLGEISSYPPGYKENAGVFCHTNAWIIIAECIAGRGDQAFEYYRKISPGFREEISELHCMEPYVYAQMIAGKESRRHGEAKNSWLTGTAAWQFVALSQWILGIRPEFGGLRVDPCVPREWKQFSVVRRFRDATYRIHVDNPHGVCRGVKDVHVDGSTIFGNLLPVFTDGKDHFVEVVLGQ